MHNVHPPGTKQSDARAPVSSQSPGSTKIKGMWNPEVSLFCACEGSGPN